MTSDIKGVQKARTDVYGDFGVHAVAVEEILASLATVYEKKENVVPIPKGFKAFLFYATTKLVRLAATPTHQDSALDLSSYAELWLKELKNAK